MRATRVLFVPVQDDPEKPGFDPRRATPAVNREATPVWKVALPLAGQFVRYVTRAGRHVLGPATAGFGEATWVSHESCEAHVKEAGDPAADHLLVLYRPGGRAALVVAKDKAAPLGEAAEASAFWASAAADMDLSGI